MKKNRRLLHQLKTLIVSLVIVGSSVFLCAPMESFAQGYFIDNQIFYGELGSSNYSNTFSYESDNIPFLDSVSSGNGYLESVDSELYYNILLAFDFNIISENKDFYFRDFAISYSDHVFFVGNPSDNSLTDNLSIQNHSGVSLLCKGSDLLEGKYKISFRYLSPESDSFLPKFTIFFNLWICNCEIVSSVDGDSYELGYSTGYSAGESAGYGNGYSAGYSAGESSVDTDSFYNNGFQAGVDSVDTDSFYDAGYQAGYDAAYTSGYATGYDFGYESAMSRIDGWGADTAEYPLLLGSKSNVTMRHCVYMTECDPTVFESRLGYGYSEIFDINPNHTYKIVVDIHSMGLDEDSTLDRVCHLSRDSDYFLQVGSNFFPLAQFPSSSNAVNVCFIPGDNMSSNIYFLWQPVLSLYSESFDNALCYFEANFDFYIYDCGPSGDTQNHIANQTDQLVNGFNDSQGGTVNDSFSGYVNDYNTSEDSLFTSAQTGLNDFQFFDLTSVPAVVTGLSFVTTTMTGWFNSAGGASGVGIVLSVLFTVMIVAMALGLYRFYSGKHK